MLTGFQTKDGDFIMRFFLIAIATCLASSAAFADTYVNGYYRDNGTYVQPYHRSNPDSSRDNNYSSQGNYNPYTGKQGTVDSYSNSYGSTGSSLYGSYGSGRRKW